MYIRNLKELREKKGVSQSKCSSETQIPLRSLQRYESGQNIGDTEYLCRLMDYFKISVEDLIADNRNGNINFRNQKD